MPSELTSRAVFWGSYWPSFGLATLGFGLRAVGREHVPATGPLLLVANHQSFLDPWLVGQSAPRRIRYLARDNLFKNRLFGGLIRAYGAVPIDRGFGKEGLQTVLTLLGQGNAVLVFAEGERSRTGELQPLKPGVALLLKKARCPVVPVGIAGAFETWPRSQKWPRPRPLIGPNPGIALAFGPPIAAETLAASERGGTLTKLEAAIRAAMATAERARR